MGKPTVCRSHLDWSCDGIDCELPFGHEGDHECSGDGGAQRLDGRKGADDYRPVSFEFRWREKQP